MRRSCWRRRGAARRAAAAPAAASPARAATDDERLRKVQERREALERELATLRGEEKSLLGEVERLELEVRLRGEELREIQLALQRTQRAAGRDAEAACRELETALADGAARAARPAPAPSTSWASSSYLRLLLSVERPSDIFRGYRFVTALARRDNERIARLPRRPRSALAARAAELEPKRTQEALALRDRARAARGAASTPTARRKTELLTSLVEKKETHAAYVEELEEAEGRLARSCSTGWREGERRGARRAPSAAACPGRCAGQRARAASAAASTRSSTPTRVHNGIEIEARRETPGAAPCTRARWSSPSASRATAYGRRGPRRQAPHALRPPGRAAVQTARRWPPASVLGHGRATGLGGPGLYFEMRFQGRPEDPLEWLSGPIEDDRCGPASSCV